MRRRALLAAGLLSCVWVSCGDDSDQPTPAGSTKYDSSRVIDRNDRITDLICPGSLGCATATGPLHVGVAARPITPTIEPWVDLDGDGVWDTREPFTDTNGNGEHDPVWMAGFSMGRAATGVHDDVWVRALSVRQGDSRVGLVAIDCVGYFVEEVLDIRKVAAARGLGFDHIMVASTHNHETRDTMGLWGKAFGSSGYNRPYMVLILTRAVEALAEARRNERTATISLAQVDATGFVADSRQPEVIDPVVTSMNFHDDQDVVFANMTIFGNHPEALSDENTLITSDYPHYLRSRIEDEYPGATTVFFTGALGGLMNPLGVRGCPDGRGEAQCRNGQWTKARYIGEGVAELVLSGLSAPTVTRDSNPQLSFRRKSFLVGTSNYIFAAGFGLGLVRRDVFSPEGLHLPREAVVRIPIEDALEGAFVIQTEVDAITIGPLDLVTVPGELYTELWLVGDNGEVFLEEPENADFPEAPLETPIMKLMPETGRARAIINQANDSLGYIIPKRQYDREEPHAYRPNGQYGEENSLGEDMAPNVIRGVEALYELEL